MDDINNYVAELRMNPQDSYFQPCSNAEIIRRSLRNLMNSFEKIGDHIKADEVKALLQCLSAGEYEDLE